MGLLSSLFGSAPKSKTSSLGTLSPEQDALMKNLISYFGKTPENAAEPSQPLDVAGLSGLQSTSLQALEQQAMQAAQFGTGGQQASDILKGIATQGPQNIDQYFTKTVQDPALRDFQDVLNGISRKNAGTYFSGERVKADQLAQRDLIEALTTERARVAFEARQQDLDRAVQAANGMTTASASGVNELLGLLGAGAVPRDVEQQKNQAIYDEFLRQRSAVDTRINQMLNALGIQTKENVVTTTGGSSGLLGGFLGSAGSAVGAKLATSWLPLAASDIMVKQGVKYLGKRPDGLDVIEFRYDWESPDSEPHIGLIAQQVQEVYPDAVHKMNIDGREILSVDYERLQ